MSRTTINEEEALRLIEGDQPLLERLYALGILPPPPGRPLSLEEADTVRVAGVLIHELEIGWDGIEIILQLRRSLIGTQRQLRSLLDLLSARSYAVRADSSEDAGNSPERG